MTDHQLPTGLGRPALRALAAAGISRLDHLTDVSSTEIQRLHGMGPKGVRILHEALTARGLSFAMCPDELMGADGR